MSNTLHDNKIVIITKHVKIKNTHDLKIINPATIHCISMPFASKWQPNRALQT